MNNIDEFTTMEEYDQWLIQYHAKIERNNNRILKAIKNSKGNEYHQELLKMLEDSEADILSITNHTTGTWQNEKDEYPILQGCYVDQYVNGGYTGDTYEGFCYILLKPGKYLRFHYAM